ncbi:Signal peptidase I P [compost metagenome]
MVVLRDPSQGPDKKPLLVKRVVALPGDTVEIRERQLFINGKPQSEVYTDVVIEDGDMEPIKLENDQYYVLGDNRHEGSSKDSRYFGAVNKDLIVGHAEFVFWPITKIRGL